MKRSCKGIALVILLAVLCIDVTGVQAGKRRMSVKLQAGKRTVTAGKKLALKARIVCRTKGANLVWSSSRKKIATVNKKGIVSGKKAGKTKITVRIKGTDIKSVCTVTVQREKSVDGQSPAPAKTVAPTQKPEALPAESPGASPIESPGASPIENPGTVPTGNPGTETEKPGGTQPGETPSAADATQTPVPPTNTPYVTQTPAPTKEPNGQELIPYSAVMTIDGELMTVFLINKNYDGQIRFCFNGKEFIYSGNAKDALILLANGGTTKENSDGTIRVSRSVLENGMLAEYWTIEDKELEQTYQFRVTTKNTVNTAIANCGVLYFKGDVTSVITVY